jgi:putative intracellular protease/amidase
MARVLFLLPALDFDPSEAAVSWQVLVNAGHVVCFATPDGRPAVADDWEKEVPNTHGQFTASVLRPPNKSRSESVLSLGVTSSREEA